ncbi:methionyl-tRNA formyltransferase, mitochondrial [Stomoxys calcitrans]|uniref:methionyl-tRNA formyltransferase, mitochondrial n=1 Tax=Stomoxys calcitrans TaxID=35570 RepID=UPI0027E346B6|nr:methionyl-tRNA formyltransferase, mitochondrial [Stomoxys calcitrans]
MMLLNCFKYKRKIFHVRDYTTTTKGKKLNVLFFGKDTFSLPSLKVLHKHSDGNLGVVSSFKSPANCVRLYAERQNIPLYKWPLTTDQCKPYDLGVVVSFGHMIPTKIIQAFPLGMINVHASLLPQWRGAAPIIYALMNNDKETGVSIMRIEPKRFDIGDIFAQKSVKIEPETFMPHLHKKLSQEGADLLWQVIAGYPSSFENPLKQSDENATYAPKITASIYEIDWNHLTAAEVCNRYRALYGFKSLTSKFQMKTIELLELSMPPENSDQHLSKPLPAPGFLTYHRERKCLRVQCANNTFVEVHRLRVEGKKAMSAMDFNNGFLKKLQKYEMEFQYNKTAVSC